MSITVLIPYCEMGHLANLEGCLKSLKAQNRPPDEIIVIDDSADADKPKVMKVCEPYVANFIGMPFNNYVPQWGQKFNAAFPLVKTDMIMLCCSNWALGPEWLQEVEANLRLIGRKNMIAGDSARCQPMHTDQPPAAILAWENAPPLFEAYNYNLVDEGFLTLMWTADWIPWDENFDKVASWHSVIEWGYRYLYAHDNHLWIRQHLTALHQHIPADSLRENMGANEYLKQIAISSQYLGIKLDSMKIHSASWILKNLQKLACGSAGQDVIGRFPASTYEKIGGIYLRGSTQFKGNKYYFVYHANRPECYPRLGAKSCQYNKDDDRCNSCTDYGASYGTHMDEAEVRDAFWDIGKGDIILDIGCDFGSWLLPGMAAGADRAYGWDPHQEALDVLRESLKANNWQDKVTLLPIGLYDRNGWIDNQIDEAPAFYPTKPDLSTETLHMGVHYTFEVMRLDDAAISWPEGKTYWMKLDVEATELEVLQGGVRFIERFKPNIVVENHEFKSAGVTQRVRDFLEAHGYRHIETRFYEPSRIYHSLYKAL